MRQLLRGDETYRRLFSDDDLAVFAMSDTIEDCNDSTCRLLGRTRDQIQGRTPLDLSPHLQPDGVPSREAGERRIAAVLAGLPQSFMWEFRRADGEPVEVLVQMEAVRLDSRVRLVSRIRDLSHLWRAETSLKETETRLQQILDHTSSIVVAKDLEGRYLFANPAYERLLRMPADRLIGRPMREHFSPDLMARFEQHDRRVLDDQCAIEVEEEARVGGETRTYLVNKFPLLNARGEPYAVCGIGTDITERKRTEEALRQAALAMSNAGGGAILDYLVQSLASILQSEMAFISVFTSEDRSRMRTLGCAMDGNVGNAFEYELAGTPCALIVGQSFQFFASGVHSAFAGDSMLAGLRIEGYAGFPLSDAAGHPIGLITVMSRRPLRDANLCESILKIFAGRAAAEIERGRAEEALRQSEASYRAIFDESEDAIFVHDWDNGAIVDVNPKGCESDGYTRDEMLRIKIGDISAGEPPYSSAEAKRLLGEAKHGPVRFEWRSRHRSGGLAWKEICLKPARIAGVPRVLAFSRDITARKAAEDALRSSEEQYRTMFNASLDGLVLRDANLAIVDVNTAFLEMNGVSRDELLAAESLAYVASELRDRSKERLLAVLSGQATTYEHYDSIAVRKDGTRFDVEIRVVPIRYRGRPHSLSIVRDVTERTHAERKRAQLEGQLRQAQKMETIGQLTGGIAHDFNNILTSIMGNVALATERQDEIADQKLGTYLGRMQRSCERARDLIQQMLTFSRGSRGEPQQLKLLPLVQESTQLLRSTLPSTLVLSVSHEEDVPPVMIDPVQVEQVLLNLCINARDAIGARGTVAIGVRSVTLSGVVCNGCRKPIDGDFVELSVRDNGHGIKPEVMERIFEPFFTTKEVGKGTGMGLATVHGIAHEHGGHVLVDSAPSQGATFRVLLPPLADDPENAAPAEPRSAEHARPRAVLCGNVLLVDDEEMVLEFMRDLLEGWGLRVTALSDSVAAHQLLMNETSELDLLITDQTMPQMTGLDLARALKTSRPALPIILYTGYADGLSNAQARVAGLAGVLRKPVAPRDLLALLHTHLPGMSTPQMQST